MRAFVLIIVFLFGSTAAGQQPKEITNSIGMKLVLIPAGTFTMGSPMEEVRSWEKQHEVTISKPYYGPSGISVGPGLAHRSKRR